MLAWKLAKTLEYKRVRFEWIQWKLAVCLFGCRYTFCGLFNTSWNWAGRCTKPKSAWKLCFFSWPFSPRNADVAFLHALLACCITTGCELTTMLTVVAMFLIITARNPISFVLLHYTSLTRNSLIYLTFKLSKYSVNVEVGMSQYIYINHNKFFLTAYNHLIRAIMTFG